MAGGAIDLDEIAAPEILDPRQVKGAAFRGRSPNVLRAPDSSAAITPRFRLPPVLKNHRGERVWRLRSCYRRHRRADRNLGPSRAAPLWRLASSPLRLPS